jgi:hypothetical protein
MPNEADALDRAISPAPVLCVGCRASPIWPKCMTLLRWAVVHTSSGVALAPGRIIDASTQSRFQCLQRWTSQHEAAALEGRTRITVASLACTGPLLAFASSRRGPGLVRSALA